jgi:hypothetical protein
MLFQQELQRVLLRLELLEQLELQERRVLVRP